jgi:spore coat protein U-like protein
MRKIAALLALSIAALVLGASASAASKTLTGTVGPGFTITLKSGSASVKKLAPGSYTIVIHDKSNIHNFHLTGPGVNKSTSVSAVTTVTWNVTLKKGTYKFVCDPHKTIMKGSFTVS